MRSRARLSNSPYEEGIAEAAKAISPPTKAQWLLFAFSLRRGKSPHRLSHTSVTGRQPFTALRIVEAMLHFRRSVAVPHKNKRVELEMKILKARQLARQADDTTRERLEGLAAELEQKLREMDN